MAAGFDIRQESARAQTRTAYGQQLVSAGGALTAEENLRLLGKLATPPTPFFGR